MRESAHLFNWACGSTDSFVCEPSHHPELAFRLCTVCATSSSAGAEYNRCLLDLSQNKASLKVWKTSSVYLCEGMRTSNCSKSFKEILSCLLQTRVLYFCKIYCKHLEEKHRLILYKGYYTVVFSLNWVFLVFQAQLHYKYHYNRPMYVESYCRVWGHKEVTEAITVSQGYSRSHELLAVIRDNLHWD